MSAVRRAVLGVSKRSRALVAASLAVALLAGTLPARAQSAGERIVGEWAEALRGAGARVAWSGLSHASGEDRLDLRDVAIEFADLPAGPVRITIPTARFVGLADRAEGGVTAREISLPRLAMSVTGRDGTLEIEVADVEQSDVTVPRFDPPAWDHDHQLTSFLAATRLLDPLAAGRAAIGRLTVTARSNGKAPPVRLEMTDATVTGLSAGRMEKIRVGGLRLETADAGKPMEMSVAAFEAADWAPVEWRRILDDDAYANGKGDGVWRRLEGAARAEAISIRSADIRMTVARITSAGRWVRQFDQPLGRLLDRFHLRRDDVSTAEGLRILHEMFQATRHDGWAMEGFRLAGGEVDHADVARMTVGAFSGAGIADLSVDGLDVVTRDAVVRLARLGLRDLHLPDADDLRRAILAATAGAEIDPSSLMPTLAHLDLDGLETITAGEPMVRLGSLRLDFDRFIRALPTSVTVAISHFVVPASLGDADGRRTLGRLGYERIDLSGGLRASWHAGTREIAVEEASLDIADLGRVTATGRLAEVPRSVFTRPETIPEALLEMRLIEASATYFDASILGRLLKMQAEDQKMKPERLRRRLVEASGSMFRDIRDPARRRAVAAAVESFIEKPGMISGTIRPKPPASLAEILAAADDPGKFADRFDLTISATRR